MTADDVLERTRSYVRSNFLYAQTENISVDPETSLLRNGIIDSMGALELLEFVQVEFGISVADNEVTEANFGSLANIAKFVIAKREQKRCDG